jgi:hypothetical protein
VRFPFQEVAMTDPRGVAPTQHSALLSFAALHYTVMINAPNSGALAIRQGTFPVIEALQMVRAFLSVRYLGVELLTSFSKNSMTTALPELTQCGCRNLADRAPLRTLTIKPTSL